MSTQQYDLSENYRLHVTITNTRAGKHLLVESQWTGAKDPNGRQKRFELTANTATIQAIGEQLCWEAGAKEVQWLPADDTEGGEA